MKPIRDSATFPVRIILAGAAGSGRHTLAEQMRHDPSRPGVSTQTSIAIFTADAALEVPPAHLAIMLVDATRNEFSTEQALVKSWEEAGNNVLVFFNKMDLVKGEVSADVPLGWQASRVIYASANDSVSLQKQFVPLVLEMLPQQHLALGRQFPLFRLPIARQLINDTCFANAAYSFSTGLAEIVPVLDLPLNVTDMIVLTKSQAFLAYKLGLLVGFSTHWQDYVTEFGGVIGGGFLWRQIARQLVGLIPAWGIIPKVAISYSGTYVVGNAILGWYLTGRNLSAQQMKALSAQAFLRGKDYARRLGEKFPKARLGTKRAPRRLKAGKSVEPVVGEIVIQSDASIPAAATSEPAQGETQSKAVPRAIPSLDALEPSAQAPVSKGKLSLRRPKVKDRKKPSTGRICPQCAKISSADAQFCQYCGTPLPGVENG